jgi:hypothetical protein
MARAANGTPSAALPTSEGLLESARLELFLRFFENQLARFPEHGLGLTGAEDPVHIEACSSDSTIRAFATRPAVSTIKLTTGQADLR